MIRKRWPIVVVCLMVAGAAGVYVAGPLLQGQVNPGKPPAIPKELYSYRDLVKQILPAVVSIESRTNPARVRQQQGQRREQQRQQLAPDQPFPRLPEEFRKQLPPELRRFFDEQAPFGAPFDFPQEPPGPQVGFGSGFLVDPSGIVLTNYHVVAGADQVTVELHDGRKFVTKDIKGDQRTDLAIVRLHPKDGKALPFLQLGDSEKMEIGDRVLAVGAPFGLTGSVTHGIISAKGRNGFGMNMYEDFLQTDAPINPGNSGGPLINLEGKVIGINSAIKSRTGGFQGVGLAIASNLAKNVMNALIKEGVVHRGYLGVAVRDLTLEVARHLGLKDNQGVVVSKVYEGSPAAKAGLQPGDIITHLNHQPVKDGRVLQTTVIGLPLHKTVPLTVVRDGQTKELSVTIEEQPQQFGLVREGEEPNEPQRARPKSVTVDKIGVKVADLTPELREEYGYKNKAKGAVITHVEAGGLAWEAGLRKGMLITKVGRQHVTTAADARQALEHSSLEKGILLQVQSPRGGTNYVLLQQSGAASGG
jgi:serine protease Do